MEVRSRFDPRKAVSHTGANMGQVLEGAAPSNRGLRLLILQDQPRSAGGPISGHFRILDAGDNKHADSLSTLLGHATDAAEVIRTIRQEYPQCVNVVNANILMIEKKEASSAPAGTETLKPRDES